MEKCQEDALIEGHGEDVHEEKLEEDRAEEAHSVLQAEGGHPGRQAQVSVALGGGGVRVEAEAQFLTGQLRMHQL